MGKVGLRKSLLSTLDKILAMNLHQCLCKLKKQAIIWRQLKIASMRTRKPEQKLYLRHNILIVCKFFYNCFMYSSIFNSTPHWRQTLADIKACCKFQCLVAEAQLNLPPSFYSNPLLHLDHLRKSPLYDLLEVIPKGVMHHNHYFCNDDSDFYQKYIINDSRIYLTPDLKNIEIATRKVAATNGWISMDQGLSKYGKDKWLQIIVDLTAFSLKQIEQSENNKANIWKIFESKVSAPKNIVMVRDIFEKYSKHVFLKYIKNGYDRIEIRCKTQRLFEYDVEGNMVKQYEPLVAFMNSLNKVEAQICEKHPYFSYGLIFGGLKMLEDHKNYQIFKIACQSNWNRIIGFDFVQQEDKYDSLERYDRIVDQILKDFPNLAHLKKVYHAGQTNDHLSDNIDIAIRAGTVRIGHGLNILQRIDFLPHCKNICFQKNPVSNILLGYVHDAREVSAPILLGLGYPISISPDGPGKFGLSNSTFDYMLAVLSYNWNIKHLKLIGYHSINHAICEENIKSSLIKSFEASWNKWISSFLEISLDDSRFIQYNYEVKDIFDDCPNYSFSQEQLKKESKFKGLIDSSSALFSDTIFTRSFINFKAAIQESKLYGLLELMPKGCLHCCHFLTCYDQQFFQICIKDNTQYFANIQQNNLDKDQCNLAEYLYSIVTFSEKQYNQMHANQRQYWSLFHAKFQNFLSIIRCNRLFRKYTSYILNKFAKLNYSRIQFRLEPISLVEFSQNGNMTNKFDFSEMMRIINQQYQAVKLEFPNFTIGFIILGNKSKTDQDNISIFKYFCHSNWSLLVALDFEQDIEDSYHQLQRYNQILDEIMIEFDHLNIKKMYQAGNSSSHLNFNIFQAIQGNSMRICNGLNILQHPRVLARCRNICIEINPILNLIEGASKRNDLRLSIAPILLGLGFPVSINSNHSGILGIDNTIEYFMSLLSFNWSLRHMKLSFVHSINHSCTNLGNKLVILKSFELAWKQWLSKIQ